MSNLLTSSRLKVARSCQRQHHLEYQLGYRSVQTALALRFGTLVHRGLEAWWLAAKAELPQEEWLDAALAAMAGESDPFELAKAQVLLTGYHFRWKDEPYDVLAVEIQFESELRNPLTGKSSRNWRLAGKLDVVVRDRRNGLVYVVEHKTSSEEIGPGSDYFKRLRLDGQVSIYFEGGHSLGHEIAGCLYDVLGKPMQRPSAVPVLDEHGNKIVLNAAGERVRTAQGKWRQTGDSTQGYVLQTRTETAEEFRERVAGEVAMDPAKFFQRGEVVRLESEMTDALSDVWQLGQQIRESELAGRAPRNPDACMKWGRLCPFFSVCTGEASLDDETKFYRRSDVHPELATDVEREQSNQEAAP